MDKIITLKNGQKIVLMSDSKIKKFQQIMKQ
jgi:hypothetical protein